MPVEMVAQSRGVDALSDAVARIEADNCRVTQVVPAGDQWMVLWERKAGRPKAVGLKVETR